MEVVAAILWRCLKGGRVLCGVGLINWGCGEGNIKATGDIGEKVELG